MDIKNTPAAQVEEQDKVNDPSRRRFFQLAGGVVGISFLMAACHRKSPPTTTFVGTGDPGLLNYLYILQQLEAAFYTQAVATPYYGLTVSESQLLTDVRDQEIAHAEFLKGLLGKDVVTDLSFNFSAVVFADRSSTLRYAAIFEDMAVSAINGAARYFSDTQYVAAICKMASVEGRHAAYFRNLLTYNSFADSTVIDNYGLDQAGVPVAVFTNAEAYIHTTFDATKLPNQ